MMLPDNNILNAFSVDVEDYFQVSAFEHLVDRSEWQNYPVRVGQSTRCILDLLDRHGVKATFFVLGWVAERFTFARQAEEYRTVFEMLSNSAPSKNHRVGL